METNITNFDVTLEKTKLDQTAELPIDTDLNLADYEPKIKKLLKCTISPYITSKQISGNTLTVEGTVSVLAIYVDENNCLCSTEQEYEIKKIFESAYSLEESEAEVFCSASVHSSRMITESKISFKGTVKISATVYKNEITPIIADIQDDKIECLQGKANVTTPMGISEKTLILDEEIEIPASCESVSKIIRYNTSSYVTDCKIVANKVIIKGNVSLCTFYLNPENKCSKYITNIPFSQIVEIEKITEDCDCDAKVMIESKNLTTRTNSNGESREFLFVCKLNVTVYADCSNAVPILYDAYSTENTVKIENENVRFNRIVNKISETYQCKKQLSFSEGSFEEVIDLWCEQGKSSYRYAEKNMSVYGNLQVCLITADVDGNFNYFEKNIDYEYPVTLEEKPNKPWCKPSVEIISSDYTLTNSNSVEIKAEIKFNITVFDYETLSVITKIEINDDIQNKKECSSLIAYFADSGEDIWEICKKFKAKQKDVYDLNEITDKKLSSPKILIITE